MNFFSHRKIILTIKLSKNNLKYIQIFVQKYITEDDCVEKTVKNNYDFLDNKAKAKKKIFTKPRIKL